jgi:hypothetical protein
MSHPTPTKKMMTALRAGALSAHRLPLFCSAFLCDKQLQLLLLLLLQLQLLLLLLLLLLWPLLLL